MTSVGGFAHVHVTEREGAHQSPCGFDDSRWEDCLSTSTVEWLRASGHPEIPPTHAEAEALRCDSGVGPTGGQSSQSLTVGVKKRYGVDMPPFYTGDASIWAASAPGQVGIAFGSMSSVGTYWRRFDPGFSGDHVVCYFRPDATARVWWCDPLAPAGAYGGEWMDKTTFLKFARTAFVRRIVPSAVAAETEMPYEAKIEQWNIDGGAARVTTVGAPLKADGTVDYTQRLALFDRPPLTAGPPRLVTVARNRLTNPTAANDRALRDTLVAYNPGGFTQADIDAAKAAATAQERSRLRILLGI